MRMSTHTHTRTHACTPPSTQVYFLSQEHNGFRLPRCSMGSRNAHNKADSTHHAPPKDSSVLSAADRVSVTMSRAETFCARAFHDTARDSKRARALTPESVGRLVNTESSSTASLRQTPLGETPGGLGTRVYSVSETDQEREREWSECQWQQDWLCSLLAVGERS